MRECQDMLEGIDDQMKRTVHKVLERRAEHMLAVCEEVHEEAREAGFLAVSKQARPPPPPTRRGPSCSRARARPRLLLSHAAPLCCLAPRRAALCGRPRSRTCCCGPCWRGTMYTSKPRTRTAGLTKHYIRV